MNECIDLAAAVDGIIIGSLVYYASIIGSLKALLDRKFFLKSHKYDFKPAAGIAYCRRGGSTAAFDQKNKYFTISNMLVISSQYRNMTHGTTLEEEQQDCIRYEPWEGIWLGCSNALMEPKTLFHCQKAKSDKERTLSDRIDVKVAPLKLFLKIDRKMHRVNPK